MSAALDFRQRRRTPSISTPVIPSRPQPQVRTCRGTCFLLRFWEGHGFSRVPGAPSKPTLLGWGFGHRCSLITDQPQQALYPPGHAPIGASVLPEQRGAPSFRVICERVGGKKVDLYSRTGFWEGHGFSHAGAPSKPTLLGWGFGHRCSLIIDHSQQALYPPGHAPIGASVLPEHRGSPSFRVLCERVRGKEVDLYSRTGFWEGHGFSHADKSRNLGDAPHGRVSAHH